MSVRPVWTQERSVEVDPSLARRGSDPHVWGCRNIGRVSWVRSSLTVFPKPESSGAPCFSKFSFTHISVRAF